MVGKAFDLEDRLVALGTEVSRIALRLPSDRLGKHVSDQLIRCGTAPAANCAEARSCESRRDFIHKMKVGLKELRETFVWLKYLRNLGMGPRESIDEALGETDQLIAIFVASIGTARRNSKRNDT
jgi:four helix bundle protein